MTFNLFGYKIGKDDANDERKKLIAKASFVVPQSDDGAVTVEAGGAYGTYFDLEGSARNDAELIGRYREMSMQPEIDSAISEIINEAIVTEEQANPITVILDKLNYSEETKEKIREEFNNVLNLLDFNNEGQDIFKRWYIDGRLYYHMIIDKEHPEEGIQELRYIDARHIKKIREVKRDVDENNVPVLTNQVEYFVYQERDIIGIDSSNTGIKVAPDSICYVHSGQMDHRSGMILSHLHKVIKPVNQLRMVEDATVIYRLSRAPERRIFYIDVGSLPKMKAEQYLKDIMAKYRNKLVYDATTGEIRDDKKFLSMMEDYWLPRREGGRGTEIQTLPGGQNLGEMEDVRYFQEKLYASLNVPISRLKSDNPLGGLGRAAEISRDELKFSKFIFRLRNRFTQLFDTILKTQLMLKGVISRDDWKLIRQSIFYDFLKNTYFSELKDLEIWKERVNVLRDSEDYVGKYYSKEFVRRKLLRQNDEDIETLNAEMYREEQGGDMMQPPGEGGAMDQQAGALNSEPMPPGPGDNVPTPEAGGPPPETLNAEFTYPISSIRRILREMK